MHFNKWNIAYRVDDKQKRVNNNKIHMRQIRWKKTKENKPSNLRGNKNKEE